MKQWKAIVLVIAISAFFAPKVQAVGTLQITKPASILQADWSDVGDYFGVRLANGSLYVQISTYGNVGTVQYSVGSDDNYEAFLCDSRDPANNDNFNWPDCHLMIRYSIVGGNLVINESSRFVDYGSYQIGIISTEYPTSSNWIVDNYKNTPDFVCGNSLSSSPQSDLCNLDHTGQRDGTYLLHYCTTGQTQTACSQNPYSTYYFVIQGGVLVESGSGYRSNLTRIIDIQPETGTTTGNLVNFAVHAYISPADVGNIIKIRMVLHNIDQNVFLLDFLSPSDIYLFDGLATTTGDWHFSTSTYIGDGNYRFNVTMDSCASAFGQCVLEVPFFGVHIDESTQFIVNQATFLGNISQNLFRDIQQEFASTSATSTASLAQNCNPLHFDIKYCMTYLFIPDAGQLNRTFLNFRDGVLVKAPIGWIYRITSLMASSTATTSLPVISYTFQSDSPLSGNTLAFDTNNYFTQAATIVSEATSNTDHKTVWEILQPIVDLFIYLFLGFVIFGDITNIDWHTKRSGNREMAAQPQ